MAMMVPLFLQWPLDVQILSQGVDGRPSPLWSFGHGTCGSHQIVPSPGRESEPLNRNESHQRICRSASVPKRKCGIRPWSFGGIPKTRLRWGQAGPDGGQQIICSNVASYPVFHTTITNLGFEGAGRAVVPGPSQSVKVLKVPSTRWSNMAMRPTRGAEMLLSFWRFAKPTCREPWLLFKSRRLPLADKGMSAAVESQSTFWQKSFSKVIVYPQDDKGYLMQ